MSPYWLLMFQYSVLWLLSFAPPAIFSLHQVNLYDWVVAVRGEHVEGVWPITARGPGN